MISFILAIIALIALYSISRSMKSATRGSRGWFARKCPNCREMISDMAKVCRWCHEPTGFYLKPTSAFDINCPHCHEIINRWAKACRHCGWHKIPYADNVIRLERKDHVHQ